MSKFLFFLTIVKKITIVLLAYGVLSLFIGPINEIFVMPLIYIDTFILPMFFKVLYSPLIPLLTKLSSLIYGDVFYYIIFLILFELITIFILLLLIERVIKNRINKSSIKISDV